MPINYINLYDTGISEGFFTNSSLSSNEKELVVKRLMKAQRLKVDADVMGHFSECKRLIDDIKNRKLSSEGLTPAEELRESEILANKGYTPRIVYMQRTEELTRLDALAYASYLFFYKQYDGCKPSQQVDIGFQKLKCNDIEGLLARKDEVALMPALLALTNHLDDKNYNNFWLHNSHAIAAKGRLLFYMLSEIDMLTELELANEETLVTRLQALKPYEKLLGFYIFTQENMIASTIAKNTLKYLSGIENQPVASSSNSAALSEASSSLFFRSQPSSSAEDSIVVPLLGSNELNTVNNNPNGLKTLFEQSINDINYLYPRSSREFTYTKFAKLPRGCKLFIPIFSLIGVFFTLFFIDIVSTTQCQESGTCSKGAHKYYTSTGKCKDPSIEKYTPDTTCGGLTGINYGRTGVSLIIPMAILLIYCCLAPLIGFLRRAYDEARNKRRYPSFSTDSATVVVPGQALSYSHFLNLDDTARYSWHEADKIHYRRVVGLVLAAKEYMSSLVGITDDLEEELGASPSAPPDYSDEAAPPPSYSEIAPRA